MPDQMNYQDYMNRYYGRNPATGGYWQTSEILADNPNLNPDVVELYRTMTNNTNFDKLAAAAPSVYGAPNAPITENPWFHRVMNAGYDPFTLLGLQQPDANQMAKIVSDANTRFQFDLGQLSNPQYGYTPSNQSFANVWRPSTGASSATPVTPLQSILDPTPVPTVQTMQSGQRMTPFGSPVPGRSIADSSVSLGDILNRNRQKTTPEYGGGTPLDRVLQMRQSGY